MRICKSLSLCFLALILFSSLGVVVHSYTYKSGNDTKSTDDVITFHVVAHTHCDTGWLKTVDEYYLGQNNAVQWAGVQYILDSVTDELNLYPNRKFIVVEMAFFTRWWDEQDDETKTMVQGLVANGTLEFINGGWCMHDEATPYYEDKIDNMAVGHKFLLDTFNVTPTIGWQLDPFGHSNTNAAFMAQMGFDGLWFARVDYQDKDLRRSQKALEMVWQPETSQGAENQIFAAVNFAHYSAPSGFCWDILRCNDDPIMYDPDLEYYNVESKVEEFVNYARNMAENYRTTELLHTFGDDFNFQAAGAYFKNIDKLVQFTNERSDKYGVKIVYSTPSQYIKALQEAQPTLPNKTDDFFPYADGGESYWTGYFTSRVSQKGYTRDVGRDFQNIRRLVSQQLLQNSSAYLQSNLSTVLQALQAAEEVKGVLQHHDAVAGTAKQRVKEDYIYQMDKAMDNLHRAATFPLLQEITKKTLGVDASYTRCPLNQTAELCNVTRPLLSNQSVLVAIYNPVGARNQVIRLKVPSTYVQVYTQAGAQLDTDIICINQTSAQDCDLFFQDAFQNQTTQFYILKTTRVSNKVSGSTAFEHGSVKKTLQVSEGRSLSVFRDSSTFVWSVNGTSFPFRVKYNYYPSFCQDGHQNSGAYIFRPTDSTVNTSIPYVVAGDTTTFMGKVVTQITVNSSKIITNIRTPVNSSTPGIELDTFVDSIDISDNVGKEIVMIVEPVNFNNSGVFYTDSNGQEMQKRVLGYRPTWNLTTTQWASANYYPITSAIYIEDQNTNLRAALLTSRAHGATSLQNGQLEVMLHRRTLCDDSRGVGEALNETENGVGMTQWFNNRLVISQGSDDLRTAQFHLDQPNLVMLSPYTQSSFMERVMTKIQPFVNTYLNLHVFSGKESTVSVIELPRNVKVMIRPNSAVEFIVRLHNMNENTVSVDRGYFDSLANGNGYTLEELNLSANQLRSQVTSRKLNWNGNVKPTYDPAHENITSSIELRALEIRTFRLTISA